MHAPYLVHSAIAHSYDHISTALGIHPTILEADASCCQLFSLAMQGGNHIHTQNTPPDSSLAPDTVSQMQISCPLHLPTPCAESALDQQTRNSVDAARRAMYSPTTLYPLCHLQADTSSQEAPETSCTLLLCLVLRTKVYMRGRPTTRDNTGQISLAIHHRASLVGAQYAST